MTAGQKVQYAVAIVEACSYSVRRTVLSQRSTNMFAWHRLPSVIALALVCTLAVQSVVLAAPRGETGLYPPMMHRPAAQAAPDQSPYSLAISRVEGKVFALRGGWDIKTNTGAVSGSADGSSAIVERFCDRPVNDARCKLFGAALKGITSGGVLSKGDAI